MRLINLGVMITLLAGCASAEKETTTAPEAEIKAPIKVEPTAPPVKTTRPYIGVSGFLSRPPLLEDPLAQRLYDRCLPVEIMEIRNEGKKVQVTAQQGDHTIVISGINRKPFTKSHGRLPLLDRYWVKSWAMTGKRDLCAGQVKRNMTEEQFRFIAGDPEFKVPYKAAKGQFDVWTFVGNKKSKPKYYYFASGRLYSWTR